MKRHLEEAFHEYMASLYEYLPRHSDPWTTLRWAYFAGASVHHGRVQMAAAAAREGDHAAARQLMAELDAEVEAFRREAMTARDQPAVAPTEMTRAEVRQRRKERLDRLRRGHHSA